MIIHCQLTMGIWYENNLHYTVIPVEKGYKILAYHKGNRHDYLDGFIREALVSPEQKIGYWHLQPMV